MKRTIALILTIALLLTACTSTGETAQGFNVDLFSEGEELSGTLTISAEYGEDEFSGWYPLVEGFKELHPNVDVVVEHTGANRNEPTDDDTVKLAQYQNDLNVNITAGNPPDLIFASRDYASNFVPSGMIMDLNTFIENDPTFKEEDFFMNVLEAFEIKDGLHSIPNAITYDFFRLRTDVLENAGYDPDTIETVDYKLLLDVYNKAIDSGDFPELVSMGHSAVDGKAVLWNYEVASMFNRSEMTADYDNPEFIEYLEVTRAYDGSPYPIGSFVGMVFDEYFFDNSYFVERVVADLSVVSVDFVTTAKDGVTDVIPVTSAKGELLILPPYLMSIPTNAKNSALAWEFIKYCTYESDAPSLNYHFSTTGKWNGNRFESYIPINKNNFSITIDKNLEEFSDEIKEKYLNFAETLQDLPLIVKVLNPYLDDALKSSLWYDYYKTEGIATAEEVAKDMQEKAEIYFREIE